MFYSFYERFLVLVIKFEFIHTLLPNQLYYLVDILNYILQPWLKIISNSTIVT